LNPSLLVEIREQCRGLVGSACTEK